MSSLSGIIKQVLLINIGSSPKALRILLAFFIQTRGVYFNLYSVLNSRHTRTFLISECYSYIINYLT
jgi:hypothetical protein